MDEEILQVNVELYKSTEMGQVEFLANELDFDGTFDTYDEYRSFMVAIGEAYPEGVPFRYYFEKINSYRIDKILGSLMKKGLLEETWIGDEPGYKITDLCRSAIE